MPQVLSLISSLCKNNGSDVGVPMYETSSRDIVRLAAVTKAYDKPIGFNRVLHVVPLDTRVQLEHGGAHSRSISGPAPDQND